MENLAYLYLTCAYEDSDPPELIPVLKHWQQAIGINWKRLSSLAWKYMLTLSLSLALVTIAGGAQALQKGDNNPEVKALQEQLHKAGYFEGQPTGFYGAITEASVKRFQEANGLKRDGIAGEATMRKLQQYSSTVKNQNETNQPTASNPPASNSPATNSKVAVTLKRGDRSPQVKTLQEQLRVAGYFFADSSGFYGPVTEAAVKRFQEAHGIKPDGVAGPSTLTQLPGAGLGFGEDETPAPPASGSATKVSSSAKVSRSTLVTGDRGEEVRELQQHLKKAGFLEGKVDGVFGRLTEEAVLRFQEANYLATSGVAGPTTREKLARVTVSDTSQKLAQASQPQQHILELQKRLKERGFYNGPMSGILGDETQQAIQEAQEYYGVNQDDIKQGRF